ncbi:MAG: peptidoglycan editing factor PgeF [Patescibacteria group bacterium]|jgi:hypothetical protein
MSSTRTVLGGKDVRYGISTRNDGNMPLRHAGEDAEAIENRNRFFTDAGINPDRVFSAKQSHSARVEVVTDKPPRIIAADGLVTTQKNICLAVTSADCFPIFLYDPKQNIVGMLHAGWRGIVGGIVQNGIEAFVQLGSDVKDINVVIGPGIQRHHFEIQHDVQEKFSLFPFALRTEHKKRTVDLVEIMLHILAERGVRNVESVGDCTVCLSDKYFSWRRDHETPLRAMVAYIVRAG